MYILKWFRFIMAKIYNILRYVIARILRHMCNLHMKETEISQKRSKGIKNWKTNYSVQYILSVLSNKTNLILEFSSPLSRFDVRCVSRQFCSRVYGQRKLVKWVYLLNRIDIPLEWKRPRMQVSYKVRLFHG